MTVGLKVGLDERDAIIRRLDASKILQLDSHFVYKEGTHGSQYIDKDDLLSDPVNMDEISRVILDGIMRSNIPLDVICGIATGANGLSACVALRLAEFRRYRNIRSIFVVDDPEDPKHKKLIKGSLQKYVPGAKIIVIEDIVNNGNSLGGAIEVLKQNGGEVVGGICVANRNAKNMTAQRFGLADDRFMSLVEFNMDNFKEDECPMCKKDGIQSVRTDLGKGKDFLKRMKEQGRIP